MIAPEDAPNVLTRGLHGEIRQELQLWDATLCAVAPERAAGMARALDGLGVFGLLVPPEALAPLVALRLRCQLCVQAPLREAAARGGAGWVSFTVGPEDADTARVAAHARSVGLKVLLRLTDAVRAPLGRLVRLLEVAEQAGVQGVVVGDEPSLLTPANAVRLFQQLRPHAKVPLLTEPRNALGLATANALCARSRPARRARW